ncbi:YHYH protein [Dyadobacter jejuensis]|uniref:YHYH protein n=1 Tax=Dyadobacter jejuensis TaxID=1082580 RepID=A0A316AJB5_9BACT|nr:YHYH protein [Dyadobacter jejuensis]PWJ57843.1 YHYH protein [Dyadobacter jejuensis]
MNEKHAKSALTYLSALMMVSTLMCSSTNNYNSDSEDQIIPVNPEYFIEEGLLEPITKVEYQLSDGTTALCYKIVTNSTPTDHQMGPWCPTHLDDGADKGGIWMEGGKIYDVDGAFIKNLSTFYKDAKWKLYQEDGTINITDSKEACEAAARPDVDPAYYNYCVQCLPSYTESIKQVFYIPITPMAAPPPTDQNNHRPSAAHAVRGDRPRRGQGGPPGGGGGASIIGIAFNGVNFDPPAPTADILKHYTLAPLDDSGGHINPHAGYHYHAATGNTKKIKQKDVHAAMIGYAMDGYGLFELLDEKDQEPVGLDELRGHYDKVRGYHYHVGPAGGNKFINGFKGKTGGYTATFQ